MASSFRINDLHVSKSEYQELTAALKSIRSSGSTIDKNRDGNLSSAEIQKFLDLNKNGILDLEDFQHVSPEKFGSLKQALRKHGIDLFQLIAEYSEASGKIEEIEFPSGDSPRYDHPLLHDREFALASVRRSGKYLSRFPHFQNDREILREAIKNYPYGATTFLNFFRDIPPELKSELRAFPVIENWVQSIKNSPTQELWDSVIKELHREGIHFPFPIQTYAQFQEGLKKSGVDFPERIRSLRNLAQVLNHREPNPKDTRPVAFFLFPKTDYNGAFSSYPVIDTYFKHGKHRIVYAEVRNEEEAAKILSHHTQNFTRPFETLWIGGHGDGDSLSLGGPLDSEQINRKDFRRKPWLINAISRAVARSGTLVLFSCSAGNKGTRGDNLINRFSEFMRPDVRVLGPKEPSNIKSLEFEGDKVRIDWFGGSGYLALGQEYRQVSPFSRFLPDKFFFGYEFGFQTGVVFINNDNQRHRARALLNWNLPGGKWINVQASGSIAYAASRHSSSLRISPSGLNTSFISPRSYSKGLESSQQHGIEGSLGVAFSSPSVINGWLSFFSDLGFNGKIAGNSPTDPPCDHGAFFRYGLGIADIPLPSRLRNLSASPDFMVRTWFQHPFSSPGQFSLGLGIFMGLHLF